jgi:hypothetical protein
MIFEQDRAIDAVRRRANFRPIGLLRKLGRRALLPSLRRRVNIKVELMCLIEL